MGERAIINRINKLRELEVQQKAIEEQMDALKAEIKKDMQEKELTEMQAGNFVVRFITICSNKFDSKTFKKGARSTL